ncbi:hypothetical protein GBAR_LOCUS7944 [Geodia barretti]|uniref:Uncharacterized protein n=1 Tax=Geodia barretti TaxID=519541 RepID=A0AA35RKS1_GEOBA|nr:hypothetical protein GBAR_LOCUS7944 [Geodia barretti]
MGDKFGDRPLHEASEQPHHVPAETQFRMSAGYWEGDGYRYQRRERQCQYTNRHDSRLSRSALEVSDKKERDPVELCSTHAPNVLKKCHRLTTCPGGRWTHPLPHSRALIYASPRRRALHVSSV